MRRHRPIMTAMKNPCFGNPSVSQIAGPPAPARVSAWDPSSPYWWQQAAWGTSPYSRCPPGTVMGVDRNCYPTRTWWRNPDVAPATNPETNQGHRPTSSSGLGTVVGKLGRALNPMNSPIMRLAMPGSAGHSGGMTMYGDRRSNPQPTILQRIAARFTR